MHGSKHGWATSLPHKCPIPVFGFFEEKAAKVLGLSKIWSKHGSMAAAWAEITDGIVKTQEESVPMLWGKQHEPNMLAMLLEDQQVMEVHECGFISNTSTSLHIGASPDALLKTRQGATVAVECKAPCPFKENKGSGQESWTYLPGKAGYDYVPAAWYAQCQVTMLACQREKCWLLEYLLEKTKMYIVHANQAWQDGMLDLVKELVHQRGGDLSSSQEQRWLSFLKLTKESRPFQVRVRILHFECIECHPKKNSSGNRVVRLNRIIPKSDQTIGGTNRN